MELDKEVPYAQMPGSGAESLRAKQKRKGVTLSYQSSLLGALGPAV